MYELAPLRRRDVAFEAATFGLDAEHFVRQVIDRGVQAFASRPITLNLLMLTFKRDGQLPDRLADIYEKGLPLMCEETPGRQRVRLPNRLSGKEQVAVAARIAGVLVLSNRSTVRIEPDRGDGDESEVTVADLAGYSESSDGTELAIGETQLTETLVSGLFADAGPGRRMLAHKTYTEFLVARYLHLGRFTKRQIYNLIAVPGESELTIAPQLEEIAAWLASMKMDVLQDVLRSQPEILVRGDIATLDADTRRQITDGLLARAQSRAILGWHPLRQHLRKLKHLRLAGQLQPHISNKTASEDSRIMAIEIARACSCEMLSDDLVDVSLDQGEAYQLRIRATDAVAEIGTTAARLRLTPLARSEAGADPDDELRGYALRALWPDHISAQELFRCLGRSRNTHFAGSYAGFLRFGDFADSLQPSDLPEALRWIEEQDIAIYPTDELRDPAHSIVIKAWDRMTDNPILTALARVFWARLSKHDDLAFGSRSEKQELEGRLRTDATKRRVILRAMVRTAGASNNIASLRWSNPNLARSEDFGWIVFECLYGSPSEAERWAELARHTFDYMNRGDVDLAHSACASSPELKTALGSWFAPVMLNSREASVARKAHRRKRKQEAASKQIVDPPPALRVRQAIGRSLTEDARFWIQLLREMSLESDSTHYQLFMTNPMGSPGWRDADSVRRRRIVDAATRYVRELTPDETWIGTKSCTEEQFAAFPALRLLLEVGPAVGTVANDDLWYRWAPSILAFLVSGIDDDTSRIHRAMVVRAYERAPQRILSTLEMLVRSEDAAHGHLFILDRVRHCSDEAMMSLLLSLAGNRDLSPKATGNLLHVLLTKAMPAGRALATSLILCTPNAEGRERDRSIHAAAELLATDHVHGWDTFWAVTKRDDAWGRSVFEMLSSGSLGGSFPQQLSEGQIGDLLDWILTEYSPNADPPQASGFLGAEDQARRWRDSLLMRLRDWGSAAALAQIRRLRAAHPELVWLDWTERVAKKARDAYVWQPANPRDIVLLSTDPGNRIVVTEEQLLEALCESLGRLQEKLQGTPARARLLWDTRVRRPKAEEDLSDFIVAHLQDDLITRGVVLGREMKIRRRNWADGQPAQIVDINATAIGHHGRIGDPLHVIIEIKGCWNRELKTAMETQLLARYLVANRRKHGLYVVGWFLCDFWDPSHDQRADTERLFSSIADCRTFLEFQARDISAQLADTEGSVRTQILDLTLR